jgi:hypothetical protein
MRWVLLNPLSSSADIEPKQLKPTSVPLVSYEGVVRWAEELETGDIV